MSSTDVVIDWLYRLICIPLCDPIENEIEVASIDDITQPDVLQMDKIPQRNPIPLHAYASMARQEVATAQ